MITLATFMPEYFNNNGDQGNLEVLSKHLEWRGVRYQVVSTDFENADFLMVGDGSRAVMREFSKQLEGLSNLLTNRLQAGKATLLVGSAHEFFCHSLSGLPSINKTSRVSEFRAVRAADFNVLGYRNSDYDLDLFIDRAFVSTSLFGPVLAKNPDLLSLLLESMGVSDELSSEQASSLNNVVERIRADFSQS
jgi:CobQ-like glutamine amidotransferase family enzyme